MVHYFGNACFLVSELFRETSRHGGTVHHVLLGSASAVAVGAVLIIYKIVKLHIPLPPPPLRANRCAATTIVRARVTMSSPRTLTSATSGVAEGGSGFAAVYDLAFL